MLNPDMFYCSECDEEFEHDETDEGVCLECGMYMEEPANE